MKRGLALLCIALLPAGLAAQENPFEAREDSYDVQWGGMTLGHATIALTPLDKGCFRYESVTHPMALVRWTYGSPRETSEFCVDGERIVPLHFEYRNERRQKDSYTLDFDWTARTVKTIKGGNVSMRELPDNAYDRFVLQQAVRLWVMRNAGADSPPPVAFTMVDDDRMKTYRFAIVGRESIDTPVGRFDTIRVERVDSPDKTSRFWVAPERSYTPIRIEHVEDGDVKLRMVLRS